MSENSIMRCDWTGSDGLMQRYHDEEWGSPLHDDRKWFEFIALDAFQAGLSWRTILHKREAFRAVFFEFDPERVARMTKRQMESARENASIVRNRLKIEASVRNARAFLDIQDTHGSFDSFIWSFSGGKTVVNQWIDSSEVPARTELSDRVSKALKERGFSFVGSTICYSFLQAGGIVNDHLARCFRHSEV